jgi:predicted MFS family arabinose efflux permease
VIRDRVTSFLGLRRDVVLLLGAIVLISTGEETWMRFVPKYLEVLGASVFVIGLFDALKTLLGALYAYPGGVLADAWGHRRALLVFTWLSLAGYATVFFVGHWGGVLAGMFLFLGWSNLSLPALFSVVGRALPVQKHAMGIGLQSLIKRLPIMIGPIAGGILMDGLGLTAGFRAGVLLSILLALPALALQWRFEQNPVPGLAPEWQLARTVKAFSPGLRRLLLSDILIRFCERLPFAWVVIYAMNHLSLSASQVGVLIAVEMATAAACYIPASYLADRYGREPFVMATFFFFTLFPLTLLVARSFELLLMAFVVRGLKEFGEPARKALIIGLAPESARGRTIGAYYLIRDVGVTAGSFIGAALWAVGPTVNFWGAFLFGALGTVVYWASLRRGTRTPEGTLA